MAGNPHSHFVTYLSPYQTTEDEGVHTITPYFFIDRRSIRGVDPIANVPEAIGDNKNY
jgi:hypothetical protein